VFGVDCPKHQLCSLFSQEYLFLTGTATEKKRGKSYQTVIKCNWARTQPICYGGCWAEIVREGEGAIARVLGAGGGRPRGFAHGRQERRDFLLISCLIRLIHLLSLYREVYLTPKQATN